MRKLRAALQGWRQTPNGRWLMFVVAGAVLVVLVAMARGASGRYLTLALPLVLAITAA